LRENICCSEKGRPKKKRKEVIDVNMKVRGLKRSDVVNRTLWKLGLQKPIYLCMQGQQTGIQANNDWSKMKKYSYTFFLHLIPEF